MSIDIYFIQIYIRIFYFKIESSTWITFTLLYLTLRSNSDVLFPDAIFRASQKFPRKVLSQSAKSRYHPRVTFATTI